MQETQEVQQIQCIRYDYTGSKFALCTNQINIYENNECKATINKQCQMLRWAHPKFGVILGVVNENEFELYEEKINEWILIWKYEGDKKLVDVKMKDMLIAIALTDRIEFYYDSDFRGMIELDNFEDDIKCLSWYKGQGNMLCIGTDKGLYIYYEDVPCIWKLQQQLSLKGINDISWHEDYVGVAHDQGCFVFKFEKSQLMKLQSLCEKQIIQKINWNVGCNMISLEQKDKSVYLYKVDGWALIKELTDSKIEQM